MLKKFEIIGNIIRFPIKLCKSALKQVLFGKVPDEELLHSYLNYLPFRESSLIKEFSKGKQVVCQPITDILSEHCIFDKPTQENLMDLCVAAANVCFVRMPCFTMQSVTKWLGSFWENVTPSIFDLIFQCLKPSEEGIIECLKVEEVQQKDQKIATWLHRCLRA